MDLLAQAMSGDWHQYGALGGSLAGGMGVFYALVRVFERWLDRKPGKQLSDALRESADHDILVRMAEMQNQVVMSQAELTQQLGQLIRCGSRQTDILDRMEKTLERLEEAK